MIYIVIIVVVLAIMNYRSYAEYREKKFWAKTLRECDAESRRRREESDAPQQKARTATDPPMPNILRVEVKGTFYRQPDEIVAAQLSRVGDTVILQREPTNPKDPSAVKVLTMTGVHIGYVDSMYCKTVAAHIGHITSCEIVRKSRHDIPFIDIVISFGEGEHRQPDLIPEDFRCGPEDQMRNLLTRDPDSYRYRAVLLMVEGLYETDRATIAKARACRKGDKVTIKKGVCDKYYRYRLDFYLEDGTYIGHTGFNYSGEAYALYDHIAGAIVQYPIDKDTLYRIGVYAFLPSGLKCPEQYNQPLENPINYKGQYPEVSTAWEMRTKDPARALEMLLPIAKKERGIEAKMECIACMYHTKDWAARVEMIEDTLVHIYSLTDEDLPPDELAHVKSLSYTFVRQLEYSKKRLEVQNRKKKEGK